MVDDFRGRGGSPWGSPQEEVQKWSGRGSDSANIDELIKNLQDKINKFLPGGARGGKPIILGLTILVIVWALSGLYRVYQMNKV